MATARLLEILEDTADVDLSLYKWCARYCVFRDGRQPDRAENVPLINYNLTPLIVRQAYVEDGAKHLVLAGKNPLEYEDVVYTGNETRFGLPSADDLADVFALTVADMNFTIEQFLLDEGTLVMVDDPNGDSDTKGAGGIPNAPPPSYRLVGVMRPIDPSSKIVMVRAFIRGEHFLETPLDVEVAVMGFDKFYSVEEGDETRVLIANAIRKANNNMDGLGTIRDTSPTVAEDGKISHGTPATIYTMEVLHASVISPAFTSTPEGAQYAAAVKTPMLYTYALTADRNEGQLTRAIDALDATNIPGTAHTKNAAVALSNLLFVEVAIPVEEPTPQADPADKQLIADLQGKLQRASDAESLLQKENANLLLQVRQLETDVTQLSSAAGPDIASMQADLTKAETHIVELEARLEACKSERDSNRAAAASVDDLRRDVTALEGENTRLNDRYNRAVEREAEHVFRIHELEEALEEARRTGPEPRPRVPEPGPEPMPEPELDPRRNKYWPTKNAEDYALFLQLSEEINRIGREIIVLEKRLRRNPDDNVVRAALDDKRKVMAVKNKSLRELMR